MAGMILASSCVRAKDTIHRQPYLRKINFAPSFEPVQAEMNGVPEQLHAVTLALSVASSEATIFSSDVRVTTRRFHNGVESPYARLHLTRPTRASILATFLRIPCQRILHFLRLWITFKNPQQPRAGDCLVPS
ncbi:hypothetical protein LshimejAT787_0103210 [Lyophyllum shimeji]|uniref:Uncharacterized protein n=1 Tax=Lyophyllum shimeji TaxID=47721 RepID=A0A9P3PDE7_LYOSH|nr:hypothetical protein LshimejAT787_0103210 [Lyophyllum shimeji]